MRRVLGAHVSAAAHSDLRGGFPPCLVVIRRLSQCPSPALPRLLLHCRCLLLSRRWFNVLLFFLPAPAIRRGGSDRLKLQVRMFHVCAQGTERVSNRRSLSEKSGFYRESSEHSSSPPPPSFSTRWEVYGGSVDRTRDVTVYSRSLIRTMSVMSAPFSSARWCVSVKNGSVNKSPNHVSRGLTCWVVALFMGTQPLEGLYCEVKGRGGGLSRSQANVKHI